jgi:hypothetical protein
MDPVLQLFVVDEPEIRPSYPDFNEKLSGKCIFLLIK